jgi:hypothetical protein
MVFLKLSCWSIAYSGPIEASQQLPSAIHHILKTRNLPLQRAVRLVNQVSTANSRDLRILHQLALPKINKLLDQTENTYIDFINKVCNRIKEDKWILTEYKLFLDKQVGLDKGSYVLRKSLGELIGYNTITGEDTLGILDKCIQFLQNRLFDIQNLTLEKRILNETEIVVVKTMFIYINLHLTKLQNLFEYSTLPYQLQLLYPVKTPEHTSMESLLRQTALWGLDEDANPVLYIPNAGFMEGGHIHFNAKKRWKMRGIDCSALAFWATYYASHPPQDHEPKDPSTKKAAIAWCILAHQPFEEIPDADETDLRHIIDNSCCSFILENYAPILNDHLEEGDIVIWRKTDPLTQKSKSQIALFGHWLDEQRKEFIGINAVKNNEKGVKFINFAVFKLESPNTKRYALRVKHTGL